MFLLKEEIFKYLKYTDVIQLSRTNKYYYSVLNDPDIWMYLLNRDFNIIYHKFNKAKRKYCKLIVKQKVEVLIPNIITHIYQDKVNMDFYFILLKKLLNFNIDLNKVCIKDERLMDYVSSNFYCTTKDDIYIREQLLKLIDILLSHGIDVNSQDTENSLLHNLRNDSKAIDLLLKYNVDLNLKCEYTGETVITKLVKSNRYERFGDFDGLKHLIRLGADLSIKSHDNESIFDLSYNTQYFDYLAYETTEYLKTLYPIDLEYTFEVLEDEVDSIGDYIKESKHKLD